MVSPFNIFVDQLTESDQQNKQNFNETVLRSPFALLPDMCLKEVTSNENITEPEELYEDELMNLEMQEREDESEEVEEYDYWKGDELQDNAGVPETESETDMEEWEEDWLENTREGYEDSEPKTYWEYDVSSPSSDTEDAVENFVSNVVYSNWFDSVVNLRMKFPAEPEYNIDQLPIPIWINQNSFYHDFIQKHGTDAKTIIGDVNKKVKARYFVLHDTAVAAEFTPARTMGKGVHMWLNAKTPVLMAHDWNEKGLAVKLERTRNNSFVHIEITRDKNLQSAVQKKTGRKKITYEEIMKVGGVKNFGTYYNDRQYELLAYAYIVASFRKGKFLTVTIHREVDRSVVKKRKNGVFAYGHDDPQFFDLDYFYGIICQLLKIPSKATFGIQNKRALALKQSNMAGYVNEFIPYVTGEAGEANQYGELMRLIPSLIRYKLVNLKHGTYYDVTHLKNKLQRTEISDETGVEVLQSFSPSFDGDSTPGIAPPSIPQFICEDSIVPGYTCYVKIDLGKGNYSLNMTGIYIPAAFDSQQPIDVLLYLHGMTGTFPGECARINEYWSITDLPKFDLRIREEVNGGGKNIILAAPSLGKFPNSYNNTLSGKNGGLDNYLEKVLTAVNEYIVQRRFKANPVNFRNIILAAHSAGGRQMRMIATHNNPVYGPKISECWGFDCLYDGVNIWTSWAKDNPDKKLIIYYLSSTSANSIKLDTDSKRLPNVFVKQSSAKNHYLVPKMHLRDRVLKIGSLNLTKTDFEKSEQENYDEKKSNNAEIAYNNEEIEHLDEGSNDPESSLFVSNNQ